MAVLADGPAGERLEALLDAGIERIETDIYYFGVEISAAYRAGAHAPAIVLDKLTEWKKGDPKPWAPRHYKPYFSRLAGRVPAGLVGGVTRGGVKGASSASP